MSKRENKDGLWNINKKSKLMLTSNKVELSQTFNIIEVYCHLKSPNA